VTDTLNKRISRALVVGGGIGLRHFKNLQAMIPDIDVRILSTHSGINKNDGEIKFVSNLESAKLFDPQITVVANPSSHHAQIVSYLAPTGCAFFIEKPLAASLGDAQLIKTQTNLFSSFVMIGYNLRFSQSLHFFKDLLDRNEYGRAISVKADVGQDLRTWRPNTDYLNSVSAQKFLGGGVLLELSHELDYLSWIFGDLRHIQSMTGSIGNLEIDVEDFAYIHMSTSKLIPISLTMDFFRSGKSRECIVMCENATLKWDGIDGSVSILSGIGKWELMKKWEEDLAGTYTLELQHFLDCVSTERFSGSNFEESIKIIELIETIKLNAHSMNEPND
jgi:predicted dehydrogenase